MRYLLFVAGGVTAGGLHVRDVRGWYLPLLVAGAVYAVVQVATYLAERP